MYSDVNAYYPGTCTQLWIDLNQNRASQSGSQRAFCDFVERIIVTIVWVSAGTGMPKCFISRHVGCLSLCASCCHAH